MTDDVFTTRELYGLFQQINERLTRIETRLDTLATVPDALRDLEHRVRVLENARALLVGIGAAVSLVISVLVTYLRR
jgi:hypothetical protein